MGRTRRGWGVAAETGPVLALHYTRISGTEKQREGYSLDAQLTSVREYSAARGWVIDREFQDVMTGKRDDRPGYQALLERVRELRAQGQRVAVVVKWLSRFGRRLAERVRSWEEFDALGAELHSLAEGGRITELQANILAVVAQEESRQTAERVSDMAEYLNGKGWLPGRIANWGFMWRDPTPEEKLLGAPRRVLTENPDEAPSVREAWRRAAAGESARSLYRWAGTLPLIARGGRTLPFAAIRLLLLSPVYVARPGGPRDVRAGEDVLSRPKGHWPALIDDETWRAVQARRRPGAGRSWLGAGKYLLTGVLVCPTCGGRMVGTVHSTQHRRADGTPYGPVYSVPRYRCIGRDSGAAEGGLARRCNKTVHGPSVDADVLRQLGADVLTLADLGREEEAALRRWWRQEQRRLTHGTPDLARQRRRFEAEREEQTAQLAEATRLLVKRKVDKAGYDALRAEIDAELARIAEGLARLDQAVAQAGHRTLADIDEVFQKLGGWQRALAGSSVDVQRRAVVGLVEQVKPVPVSRGRYEAEIDWTPEGWLLARLGRAAREAA